MKRRQFLLSAGCGVAAPAIWSAATQALPANTFPFSVASGDPTSDAVILWTRLARDAADPTPVAPGAVEVEWLVATDEKLAHVVRRGVALARPELGHSVHVDVQGLLPDRAYWYAFRVGTAMSPVGRTRTLPAPGTALPRFRFNFVCCQHWEQGYFDAYDGMAGDDAALILHLGDYIYDANRGAPVRAHETPEAPRTLAEFRRRHALYKGDAALRRAHESLPFLAMPDNHDVVDDGSDDPDTLRRRAAAYQAWYEFLPVRQAPAPGSPSINNQRSLDIGNLLRLNVPDTRQYRDLVWACRDGSDPDFAFGVFQRACDASKAKTRTLLGKAQESWVTERLTASPARWNVLASTVMLTPLDMRHDGEIYRYMAAWDGYPAARDRLLDIVKATGAANPVCVSGDIHASVVSDVVRQVGDDPKNAVLSEFTTTSISALCPDQMAVPIKAALPANPHIRFCDTARRGYMRCTVTGERWTTDLRVIDATDRPGGTVSTAQSFVIEDGRRGVQRA